MIRFCSSRELLPNAVNTHSAITASFAVQTRAAAMYEEHSTAMNSDAEDPMTAAQKLRSGLRAVWVTAAEASRRIRQTAALVISRMSRYIFIAPPP